jgi:hypothetical protein
MPKLKNTETLLKRAYRHQMQDEIAQGTYGRINGQNGDASFEGCVIGCLAIPNTINEIISDNRIAKFVRTTGGDSYFLENFIGEYNDGELTPENSLQLAQRNILKEDFGICRNLSLLAELVFEAIDDGSHKYWPAEFAASLNDGVKITNKQISKWVKENDLVYWLEKTKSGRAIKAKGELSDETIQKIKGYIKEIGSA